jgi:Rrf2 family transcriptional regulator, nitric oxide-sensitive transcriptional repressor
MYAAAHTNRLVTIEETSKVYGISRTHLMKIANMLTRAGYIKSVRGRGGGLMLARRPEKIRVSDVVRTTEPDFALADCFISESKCPIAARCRVRKVLNEALAAFLRTLDSYTVADLLLKQKDFDVASAAVGSRGLELHVLGGDDGCR